MGSCTGNDRPLDVHLSREIYRSSFRSAHSERLGLERELAFGGGGSTIKPIRAGMT